MRPAEESVAAILDIKFVNVIAELLIEHYELVNYINKFLFLLINKFNFILIVFFL